MPSTDNRLKERWKRNTDFYRWASEQIARGRVVIAIKTSDFAPFVGFEIWDNCIWDFTRCASWDLDNPIGLHPEVEWYAEDRAFFIDAIEGCLKDY